MVVWMVLLKLLTLNDPIFPMQSILSEVWLIEDMWEGEREGSEGGQESPES